MTPKSVPAMRQGANEREDEMAILKIKGLGQVDKRRCHVCGCTQLNACSGGCYWVTDNLCSKCANRLDDAVIEKMIENPKIRDWIKKSGDKTNIIIEGAISSESEIGKAFLDSAQTKIIIPKM